MPRAMLYPQSVTIEGILYVNDRGGHINISRVIHRYGLHSQHWLEPLKYQYWCCSMTTVSSQLVMVGGWDVSTKKTSKTVAVYSTSQRSWKQPYPPMNTPRYWPAISTYHQCLVVAGGGDTSGDLATVEILDTSTLHSQWLSATPLPMSCRRMSVAIIHSTLYLLGGSLGKQVLCVSLPALTQTDKPHAQWRTLPDNPLEGSAAIAVHGSVLAVGGSHGYRQRSSAIHIYNQDSKWNKVGHLPTEQAYCTCCLLPSGEILVAGGGGSTRRMDVAAVKD